MGTPHILSEIAKNIVKAMKAAKSPDHKLSGISQNFARWASGFVQGLLGGDGAQSHKTAHRDHRDADDEQKPSRDS